MFSFIERVRAADETTKRFWVFVLSGASMTLIAVVWAFYLNITIASVPGISVPEEKIAEAGLLPGNEPHPLLANFKRNSSSIYSNLASWFSGLLFDGNEIIIKK